MGEIIRSSETNHSTLLTVLDIWFYLFRIWDNNILPLGELTGIIVFEFPQPGQAFFAPLIIIQTERAIPTMSRTSPKIPKSSEKKRPSIMGRRFKNARPKPPRLI